jgi:hypothetical protein
MKELSWVLCYEIFSDCLCVKRRCAVLKGTGTIRVYQITCRIEQFVDIVKRHAVIQNYNGEENYYHKWGSITDQQRRLNDNPPSCHFDLLNYKGRLTRSYISAKQCEDNIIEVTVFFGKDFPALPWWEIFQEFCMQDMYSVTEIQSPPQSGHQPYSEFERFIICCKYISDKRSGSVESMAKWSDPNCYVTERTLRTYLKEFGLTT